MKKLRIGFLSVLGDEENHTLMMNGVMEAAEKLDVSIIRYAVSVRTEDYDSENRELLTMMKVIESQKPDGLMFLGWMPGIAGPNFQAFIDRFSDIPLVSVGVNHPIIPSVHASSEPPIRALIRHLIEHHGYTRIVFIPPVYPDVRQDFYVDEMRSHKIYDESLMISPDELKNLPMNERIKRVTEIVFDERKLTVDAFFCVYDTDTQDLFIALPRRGFSIPDQIAVVSNEDSEIARFSIPSVSVVTFPWREVGFLGCEKMVRILKNDQYSHAKGVPGKMILRNSCGCRSESEKLSRVLERMGDNFLPGAGYGRMRDYLSDLCGEFSATSLNVESLADALVKTFESRQRDFFFEEFRAQIDVIIRKYPEHEVVDQIEDFLYRLRSIVLTYISDDIDDHVLFDDLFLMCSILIQENRVVVTGFETTVIRKARREMIALCQEIGSTFNLEKLVSTLETGLSRVSIPSCYVYLAVDEDFAEFSLLTAYANGKRLNPDREEIRSKLGITALAKRHSCLLCQILQVDEEYFGLVFFEPVIRDLQLYDMLARQVASALKGALLHDDLKVEMELRKYNERLIQHNANFDSLTDLYNRRAFDRALAGMIESKGSPAVHRFYLLYIDFDDFKKVNDTYGHDIGDLLIQEISRRILKVVNRYTLMVPLSVKGDDPTAADEAVFRVGGDEFIAIVRHMPRADVKRLAARMIAEVRIPYEIGSNEISISMSIGISSFPDNADQAVDLVKQADDAMYRAKRKKGMYCFYDEL